MKNTIAFLLFVAFGLASVTCAASEGQTFMTPQGEAWSENIARYHDGTNAHFIYEQYSPGDGWVYTYRSISPYVSPKMQLFHIANHIYFADDDNFWSIDYSTDEYDVLRHYTGESFTADANVGRIGFKSFNDAKNRRMLNMRTAYLPYSIGSSSAMGSENAWGSDYPRMRGNMDTEWQSPGFSVWADAVGGYAKQKVHNNVDGYQYNGYGVVTGGDWSNGALTFGAAGGYINSDLKSIELIHSRDADTWMLGVYGQLANEYAYLNIGADYGRNYFDGTREVSIPYFGPYSMTSSYNSYGYQVSMEAGFKWQLGGWNIMPSVGMVHYWDSRGGFREYGDDWMAPELMFNDQTYAVHRYPFAVDVDYEIACGTSLFRPQFRVAYVPEWERRAAVDTSFVSDPSYWRLEGVERAKNGWELGVGMHALINGKFTLQGNYTLELRQDYTEHKFNAGMGVNF